MVDRGQPQIADHTQHGQIVGEQAVQEVGHPGQGQGVELPPVGVLLKHRAAADVEAETSRVNDDFGQGGDIAQTQVQPLPGDRVDHMGRVADQGQAASGDRRSVGR